MASTSDSDDFASADEDIQEETLIKSTVPSLKFSCKQELEKNQPAVKTLTVSDQNETSELTSMPLPTSPETVISSSGDATVNVTQDVLNTSEPPIERKRRQQKVREPKTSSGPKKLGTKITPSKTPDLTTDAAKKPDTVEHSVVEPNTAANSEVDPYAKFRGFSEPPIMQRCWITNPQTGEVILDKNVNKVMSRADVVTKESKEPASTAVQPDPYAQYRGFSQPPLIERCWEEGVDDVPAATKPIKVENAGNEEQKVSDPDPYSKFRGYSQPPLIERCWEEGVDDVPAATKPIKVENTGIQEQKVSDPDPYAKFRGYSQPPLIERCWEEGVDDIAAETDRDNKKEDTKENLAPVLDKLTQASEGASGGWGSWGNWSSLLSSASEGVSSLTSQVSSVLESSIGVPTPEDLAQNQLEKKLLDEMNPVAEPASGDHSTGLFGFGQLMSNVTKLVETTGNKVLTGGLDTLETIGKKTMEVLQDGDPGLKKKRAMFTDKTVLSQVLREAKEKAEMESKEMEHKQTTKIIHFETLFDDYQGLVHLEALEMLSKQCGIKLQSLLLANSGPALAAWQAKFQGMKDSCQLPDEEDMPDESCFDQAMEWQAKLSQAEKSLGIPMATEKLNSIWSETADWTKASREKRSESLSTQQIHEKAVSTLARLTAVAVEQFHKGAELLLVQEIRRPTEEAEALISITTVLCSQVSSTASRFCELLNDVNGGPKSDDVNSLITNIFLEASNSSSYIQEAFQLLIPVLQVGLVSETS